MTNRKTTEVVAARIPTSAKRKLVALADAHGTSPSRILGLLLSLLPIKTYTAEQSDALGKLLAALGLPGSATPDAVRKAVDSILGLNGLDGDDPGGGGLDSALDDTADPPTPQILSEYGQIPTRIEVEKVAARLSELGLSSNLTRPVSSGAIRPAPQPAFVVDSVTNQVKVNPARYAARRAR